MNRESWVNLILLAGLIVIPVGAEMLGQPFTITLATRVVVLATAGVGLNLALGYGGMVSFGHAAFFGLGGYAAGVLASHALNQEVLINWPAQIPGTTEMLVIWPVAMLVSALAALAIGALSLRTSGVYFIMITLAFAQMVYYFAISWPTYGGEDGLSIYVRNNFPGLNTLDPLSFYWICAAVLGLSLLLSWRLTGSNFGLALQAARQSPTRLTSVGVRPFSVQLTAFVISAVITGLAGALFADLNRFVSPTMLAWNTSGEIMVFVILGGVGRLFGPVAGAALFLLLEHFLGGLTEHWQFLLGILLLMVVLFAQGGLMGLLAGRGRRG